MSLENDFKECFNQTLIIEPYLSTNFNNDFTWGTQYSTLARIQSANKFVRDKTGAQTLSTAQIYLDGTSTITVKDRITLLDGTRPEIIKVNDGIDLDGSSHHTVVYTK